MSEGLASSDVMLVDLFLDVRESEGILGTTGTIAPFFAVDLTSVFEVELEDERGGA